MAINSTYLIQKSLIYRVFKIVRRTLLLLVILVLLIAAAGLFYVFQQKDQLAKQSLTYLNAEIAGTVKVGSVHINSLLSYPTISLQLEDVKVYQPDSTLDNSPVIDIPELNVTANLHDVLKNQFHLDFVDIQGGLLYIRKNALGKTNISNAFHSPARSDSSRPDSSTFFLGIDSISISNFKFIYEDSLIERRIPVTIESLYGDLVYVNSEIGGTVRIKSTVDTLHLGDSVLIKQVAFNINPDYQIKLKDKTVQVKSDLCNLSDIPFNIDFMYDYGEIDNLRLALNSTGKGFKIKQGSFGYAEPDSTQENIHIEGFVTFKTTTTWRSNPANSFLQNMNVDLKMHGKELKVVGVDIDQFIEKYKRSQNFNLLDVSAVLLAGPVGLAITKGADYTILVLGNKGNSCRVGHFESDWSLKKGILSTSDVALSTDNNLVSINGWYNFNKEQLDFDINLVDRKGCSIMTQRYYGDAKDAQASGVKIIKTFLGPVKNLFQDIGLGKCNKVYSGVVEHPEVTAKRKKNEAKQNKKDLRKKQKQEKHAS